MDGLDRRLFDQLYHSLTAEVHVVGRPAATGWAAFSVRTRAVVGPQVLERKFPLPRNWL